MKRVDATVTDVAVDDDPAVTLAAASGKRCGLSVCWDADDDEILYVKCGPAAADDDFTVKILGGGYWELPTFGGLVYAGIVTAVAASGDAGTCQVTEYVDFV